MLQRRKVHHLREQLVMLQQQCRRSINSLVAAEATPTPPVFEEGGTWGVTADFAVTCCGTQCSTVARVDSWMYTHGGFMAAGLPMLAQPAWCAMVKRMMPGPAVIVCNRWLFQWLTSHLSHAVNVDRRVAEYCGCRTSSRGPFCRLDEAV